MLMKEYKLYTVVKRYKFEFLKHVKNVFNHYDKYHR